MSNGGGKSLKRRQAAEYLGVPVGTMESWAKRGVGPKYTNPTRGKGGTSGTALYMIAELDRWRACITTPQPWTGPRRGRRIGSRNKPEVSDRR